MNDLEASTSGLKGWDLVQETLSHQSQETEDCFEISEAGQNRIQRTCSNLEGKIENVTQRTLDLEVGLQSLQSAMQENSQEVSLLKSKLERLENNARRNNVRILGVKEGLEGSDIKTFVISLLKNSFPPEGWITWKQKYSEYIGIHLNNIQGERVPKDLSKFPFILSEREATEFGLKIWHPTSVRGIF
ncbi:hypothetical protein NDU88_002274 [Pleurodeles waltl]|uniref:Uncharacterized protein n=1 Tax=Pleurodeles waltl TaxID=8319 RepID=A0AAV7UY77_PLEWA|nr:hypothetical protein NDU88_002274 [Pleurodeles waltl]